MSAGNFYGQPVQPAVKAAGRSLVRTLLSAVILLCSLPAFSQTFHYNFTTPPSTACNLSTCTSATVNMGGVNFIITTTSAGAGASMYWYYNLGETGGGSMEINSGAYSLSDTEKVTIKRADGRQFSFNSLYFNDSLSTYAKVSCYLSGFRIDTSFTLTQGHTGYSQWLTAVAPTVDEIRITAADFRGLNIDGLDGSYTNSAPTFANGATQSLTLNENTMDTTLNSLLSINDADAGQTLSWSVSAAASHGTVTTDTSYTATGSAIRPSGFKYVPATGYNGSDAFTVQVSDGFATAATTINVTINAVPVAETVTGGGGYCSGGSAIGLASSESGVTYQLYKSRAAIGSPVAGTGSAISFGSISIAGTYNVIGTNTTDGISHGMTNTVTVVANAAPTVQTVTGGGAYCAGGTGVAIGLASSQTGINYQLYNGATASGSAVAGTGSAISFGSQTATGTYTVVATDAATSCTSTMSGSATVSVNAQPTAETVTGGGAYCAGGTGVAVGLAGSQSGVDYQLYNGPTASGSAVPGTGSALSFGSITVVGTYTVIATDAGSTCTNAMTGSATVSANPLPTTQTVTGGGAYCAGGTGVAVGLSGSQSGINYQLYNGATVTGSAVAGTGSAISFGSETATGTYTVTATDAGTSCTSNMSGSAAVSTNPLPTAETLTGGGTYCSGTGIATGLSSSETGVNYQLYNGATAVGSAAAGTGSAISFGAQTAAGTYSVTGTNATTGCTNSMANTVTITGGTLPTAQTVTGGGAYCSGGTGVAVGLSASQSGISYQLYNGATAAGSAVAGTGSAITFGSQTAAGTYSVVGTNTTTGCTNNMTNTVTVTVTAAPTAQTVTGGGTYCSGGTGVSIGLASSQSGVSYQLYLGATASGSTVTGTGSAITFGLRTTAGTYSVTGTLGCSASMSNTVTITTSAAPTAQTITGGGNYCSGGTGPLVGLAASQSGTTYQLFLSGSSVGSPISGTGSAINFGHQAGAGTYTVSATNTTTGCTANMTGSATIVINALPAAETVTGGGSYCSGGTGVDVSLAITETGVNYQLYKSGTAVGSPMAGTGSAISFGNQTATGTYSVTGTDATFGCTASMANTVSVSLTTAPTAQTVTGGGSYCSGGSGVAIGLASSQATATYQLYLSGSAVGSPVAGTGSAITFGSQVLPGTYSVVGTSSCSSSMANTVTVTINAYPAVQMLTGGGSYCSGGTGVAIGLAGSETGMNYQLYRSGAAVGSPVAGTGSAISFGNQTTVNNNYTVTATSAAGCGPVTMWGTDTVTLTTAPVVSAITGIAGVCVSSTITLSDSTAGGTWSASNSKATVTSAGLVTGVTTGADTIKYSVSNACFTTTVTKTLSVNNGAGTISGSSLVCTGYTTTLTDAVIGGTWRSSDTTVAKITSIGVVSGIAVGTVTITNTCGSSSKTYAMTVKVSPSVSLTGSATDCMGSNDTLTGTPIGGAWFSSATAVATVSSTGVVMPAAYGTTAIRYSVTGTNGCVAYQIMSVTVKTLTPSVSAISASGTSICSGGTVSVNDATVGGTWSATNSNATISGNIVTGVTGGVDTIKYTVNNGCGTNAASKVIVVNPTAGTITGTLSACVGGYTNLSDAATGGAWSSSNASVATVSSAGRVTGVAAGTVTITYATASSCGTASTTASVTINTTSAATITGSSVQCIGVTTTLTGSPATGGSWLNYNPTIDTLTPGGVFTGRAAGTATIKYTGIDSHGCTSTVTQNFTVRAAPASSPIAGASSLCTGATTTLTDGVAGGTWSASNTFATVSGGVVTGVSGGVDTISYTVTNSCGTSMVSKAVAVNPTAGTVSGAAGACAGAYTTLASSVTGGTWSSSNTGVATVTSAGKVTGVTAGTVTITYSVTSSCGSAYTTYSFTVYPLPTVVISGSASTCIGATDTLTGNPTGSPVWFSAYPSVATVSTSGVVTGIAAGTTSIKYTGTDGNGCTSYALLSLVVHANPTAPANITGTTTVCTSATTTLADVTTGGTWSSSTPAVATVSSGMVNGISAGTSTISYTVSNSYGCTSSKTATVTVNSCGAREAMPASGNGVAEEQAAAGTVKVYPNPTNGMFTIEIPVTEDKTEVTVYDVYGKLIETRSIDANTGTVHFNLNNVARGTYLINITNAAHSYKEKVVLQ